MGSGAGVELAWLPLGAGERLPLVRWNGRGYEAWAARRAHRPAYDLYHAALQVQVDGERYVVEMAPAWKRGPAAEDVALCGPVGLRVLGRSVLFRYQVRCWRDGVIPDLAHAVDSPRQVTADPAVARRLLALVPAVPALVWGRDELRTGDMWNSNSVVAWLLASSGLDPAGLQPPTGGRAPGWGAGLVAARWRDTPPAGGTVSRSPARAASPPRRRSRPAASRPPSTRGLRPGGS